MINVFHADRKRSRGTNPGANPIQRPSCSPISDTARVSPCPSDGRAPCGRDGGGQQDALRVGCPLEGVRAFAIGVSGGRP